MSIPSDFFGVLTELDSFSRNKVRIPTLGVDTANPYDVTILPLTEAKLALNTLSLGGLVTTTTSASFANVGCIESLIDQIYIEFGGISVMPSFTYYNHVWMMLSDLQGTWNKAGLRTILNLQKTSNTAPSANQTAVPFQLNQFLGFLKDIKMLDLARCPPAKIYIKWASPAVLVNTATTTGASYQLTKLYATVDVLGLSPAYDALIDAKLSQGAISYPFTNFTSIPGGTGTLTQTTRWSTSANALEKIYGTFLSTTFNTQNAQADTVTYQSPYFNRGTTNLSTNLTSRFNVNGMPFPPAPADETRREVLLQTMQTICEDHDLTSAQHPALNSQTNWATKFWVHGVNFVWDDPQALTRVSGISGLGNQLLGTWESVSTQTDSCLPFIFLQHRSVLQLSANRNIRYIH